SMRWPGLRSIRPMIVLVPLNEACEADLDRSLRLEAEIAPRRLNIGKALRHISGLHRQQLLCCGTAQEPFEDPDEIEQFLGAVIAEIVDPMGEPARWRPIMRRYGAGDDIVDIGEVARHPTFVKDPDRLSGEDRAGEQVGSHVRSSPGPIDCKETQARRRQTIELAVGMGYQLTASLRRRIERNGL